MDKASASYSGGQVGLERATIEPKIAGSSPVGGVFLFFFLLFFFTLVLKMLHTVFFLEVVLLKTLQFNTKKIKTLSNKGCDNNLGSTSSFLLYSIGGHNNTAIKITNTYSDDQLVIYIFKRQTEQKQWMWAMISFNHRAN